MEHIPGIVEHSSIKGLYLVSLLPMRVTKENTGYSSGLKFVYTLFTSTQITQKPKDSQVIIGGLSAMQHLIGCFVV